MFLKDKTKPFYFLKNINMKLLKLVLSSIIVSCLASCGGSGGGSSSNSSGSSPVGTSDAAAPTSLPSGTEIAFNPEIIFDGELSVGTPAKARYSNDTTSSSFPGGDNDIVYVSLEIVTEGIKLSFTQGGQNVELVLSGFKDFGAGYIEEFTVEAKVDNESVGTQQGRFTGTTKPKNKSASRTFDTSGTPTEDEFIKFLVGKAIYHQETSPDTRDRGYILFNQDGTFHYFGSDDDDSDRDDYKNHKETWTYNYNGGSPILMLKATAVKKSDDSDYFYEDTIELSFENFFQGTYKNSLENDNGRMIPTNDVGKWQLFDSASLSVN